MDGVELSQIAALSCTGHQPGGREGGRGGGREGGREAQMRGEGGV